MSVLVPTLLQLVQPAFSTEDRKAQDVGRNHYEKSMGDLLAEVEALFNANLRISRLLDMSLWLQTEYRQRLKASSLSMLPSFQHTLPTGDEQGSFLALDVGGSTFRVALVKLSGRPTCAQRSSMKIEKMKSYVIDEDVRRLSGRTFFEWMALKIEELLSEQNDSVGCPPLKMGLAWSFPIEQTSPGTGKLLQMGKGFAAGHGVEGEDLRTLVMEACAARRLNVELVAIVNDGAATLLSQAYRDPATRMSLILGTGMNAAVFLPVKALSAEKFGVRRDSWHREAKRVVVNTEISMFGKRVLPATRWDDLLNDNHRLPDYQPLEYLITGRYLGEIVRLILVEAVSTTELFNGEMPKHLDEPYALDTRILAIFESDDSPELTTARKAFLNAHPMKVIPGLQELQFMRDLGRLVSRRGAAYLATALHALWAVRTTAEGIETGDASHVTIACDGSMIGKYPGFRARTQQYLDELCTLSGAKQGAVTLEMAPDSSIFGAAVAVSCTSVDT